MVSFKKDFFQKKNKIKKRIKTLDLKNQKTFLDLHYKNQTFFTLFLQNFLTKK